MWSLLNYFWTSQRLYLHRWALANSAACECRQQQTTNHTVDTCPLTTFEGGFQSLHNVDDDALNWLQTTATTALAR